MNNKTPLIKFTCPSCHHDRLTVTDSGNIKNHTCGKCGLTFREQDGIIDFLSPFYKENSPHAEVVRANRELHDELGGDYEKDPQVQQQLSFHSTARLSELIYQAATSKKEPLLADIGAGNGYILDLAREYPIRIIGFDVSRNMILVAKQKGLEVHIADACRLPLPDASVDVVTILSVLHHIYDIKPVLMETFRVLKPGGFLITDWDPNGNAASIFQSRIYQILLKISEKTRYFISGFKAKVNKPVFELAEYHRFHGELRPGFLENTLREAGFLEVNVICHSNHRSIKKLSFGGMPLLSKVRFIVMFLLSWKADKNYLHDTMLSVSKK